MYKIVKREELRPTLTRISVEAPLVARRAMPGQFIIFRIDKNGERVPLTINGYDRENGTVDIIFQAAGATTMKLNTLQEGDFLEDFVGPLGNPTPIDGLKKVAVVGGGVGCAIAYPVAKELHDCGCEVHAVTGFKNKDLVILEREFDDASTRHIVCTDDGSYGESGLVTEILKKLIDEKHIWMTSVIGAVLHNTGQMIAALILMQTPQLLVYYPFLIVSGCIAGAFTGLSAQFITKRLKASFGKGSSRD